MENLGYYNGKYDLIDNMYVPMNDRACFFGDGIYEAAGKLTELREKISTGEWEKESEEIRDSLIPAMEELRRKCDAAEVVTAKEYWPFPTYGELLFGVR